MSFDSLAKASSGLPLSPPNSSRESTWLASNPLAPYSDLSSAWDFFSTLSRALMSSKTLASSDMPILFLMNSSTTCLSPTLIVESESPTRFRMAELASITSASASTEGGPKISRSHWWDHLYLPYWGSSYLQIPPEAASLMGSLRPFRVLT